jgi:spore coat polysaccharide biosynthesis protein SpsF (cytidylyltransferase family)
MRKCGLILQARMGSTRLPGKMTAPFYNEKGVFEIILERILEQFEPHELVLATSKQKQNDVLESIATRLGVATFRGSENDVLNRFIEAAKMMGFQDLIRVCADNPFLDISALKQLQNAHMQSNADYTAFCLNDGTPSIRTHFGFWGEGVKLEALEKVENLTKDVFYHEHVTNYIYGTPKEFSFNWIPIPEEIQNVNGKVRFTLDTSGDFLRLKELYVQWIHNNPTTHQLINITLENSTFVEGMKLEIQNQSK